MNIMLSIAGWHPSMGGPFVSAGQLASACRDLGHNLTLVTLDYGEGTVAPAPPGVCLKKAKATLIPGIRQSYIPGARARFERFIDEANPAVVHDNGLWISFNHHIARSAERRGIPRIQSTRGTLDPQALSHRGWKKKIALRLGQQRVLDTVTCFHATATREVEAIRALGFKQPIALISNGVEIPKVPAGFDPQATRTALYLGRIHPIKNLEALVEAWISVAPKGWRLKIVGNAEMQYDRVLKKIVAQHHASEIVEILEPAYGVAKQEMYRSSELFLLVSKTENFGISAADAMAYGVPVVASKNTPWECLEELDSGWWVDGDLQSLSEVIEASTKLSNDELKAKGSRGRSYAQEHLSWDSIGRGFISTYQWVLGEADRPDFIQ